MNPKSRPEPPFSSEFPQLPPEEKDSPSKDDSVASPAPPSEDLDVFDAEDSGPPKLELNPEPQSNLQSALESGLKFDEDPDSSRSDLPAFDRSAPPTGRLVSLVGVEAEELELEMEDPMLGQVIGNVQLVEVIGTGGFGKVYRAEHGLLGESFAVKVLKLGTMTNREFLKRFQREARVLAQLKHENVVQISDFGKLPDGGLYIVMEFLRGASLQDRFRKREPFPIPRLLAMTSQICEVLDYIHRKGVIHRDLKPGNVFLLEAETGQEKVKLIDFGIAALQEENHEPLTQTEAFLGTAKYASPEQIATEGKVDHRTDLYSLAIILYRIIAGRLPFRGKGVMNIIHEQLNVVPPRLGQLYPNRHWSPLLEQFFGAALAKRPAQRPADALVFWQALEAALLEQLSIDEAEKQPPTGVFLAPGEHSPHLSGSWSSVNAFSGATKALKKMAAASENSSSSNSRSGSGSHSSAGLPSTASKPPLNTSATSELATTPLDGDGEPKTAPRGSTSPDVDNASGDAAVSTREPLSDSFAAWRSEAGYEEPTKSPEARTPSAALTSSRSSSLTGHVSTVGPYSRFGLYAVLVALLGGALGYGVLFLADKGRLPEHSGKTPPNIANSPDAGALGANSSILGKITPTDGASAKPSTEAVMGLDGGSHANPIPDASQVPDSPTSRGQGGPHVSKPSIPSMVRSRTNKVTRSKRRGRRGRRRRQRNPVVRRAVVPATPLDVGPCGAAPAGSRWVFATLKKPKGAKPQLRFSGCSGCSSRRKSGGFCLRIPTGKSPKISVIVDGFVPCLHSISSTSTKILWSLREDDPNSLAISGAGCAKLLK